MPSGIPIPGAEPGGLGVVRTLHAGGGFTDKFNQSIRIALK